jgi:hypothetical protein
LPIVCSAWVPALTDLRILPHCNLKVVVGTWEREKNFRDATKTTVCVEGFP